MFINLKAMKTFFKIVFLLILANTQVNGQFVTIPDTNFRYILIQNFPSCFNVNQEMDTTCSEIVYLSNLNAASASIQDLTGVK